MSSNQQRDRTGPRSTLGPVVWCGAAGLVGTLLFGAVLIVGSGREETADDPSAESRAVETRRTDAPEPAAPGATGFRENPAPMTEGRKTGAISAGDLLETVRAIETETDPLEREALLRSALEELGRADVSSVLALLEVSDAGDALYLRLFRRWAESEPEIAASWIGQVSDDTLRKRGLNHLAIAWANTDFSEAAAWARRLPDENERREALRAAAYERVRTEPVEALLVALEELPANAENDRLVRHALMEWASGDPLEAADWARGIPDDTLRERLLASVVLGWSNRDPTEALAVAVEELNAGRLRDDVIVSAAQRLARRDPEDTAAWVEAYFPPGELKRALVAGVASVWALSEADRAREWRSQAETTSPSPNE